MSDKDLEPVSPKMDYPSNVRIKRRIRRAKVARLYMKGITNRRALAEIVGCGVKTVINDLGYLRRVWEKEAADAITHHQYQEIIRLQRLEEEANEAWETSKKEEETFEVSSVTGPDGGITKRQTVKKRKRNGDPSLLRALMDISRQRSQLLEQHMAKDRDSATSSSTVKIVGIDTPACVLTDEELEEIIRSQEATEPEYVSRKSSRAEQ